MRPTLRSKLILFTVLPVVAVYALLFWVGVSQVREHFSADAQRWLVEHARHQAARLALVFSQAPALAESLGDLILADPGQSQSMLYAHLIDGLRRTPIADVAALRYGDPPRGALMRRGEPGGRELTDAQRQAKRMPGWHIDGDQLIFARPIYRFGSAIGEAWVQLSVAEVYAEIERQRSPTVSLLVSHQDGTLLPNGDVGQNISALAALLPTELPDNEVRPMEPRAGSQPEYWLASTSLPGYPWRVIAVTPSETALQPAHRRAFLVAVGLLLSLFAIILLISLATRQITRPLKTLDASVQQVALGNFHVSPEVHSADELGGLADTIRRMAGHIADREKQLLHSRQVLEQRVAERTSALQASNTRLLRQINETRKTEEALRLANQQAQQANTAKSEFLSNMSHELRTPLHGVLGYTQILRRDSDTSASQRDNLDAIERCGQHLLTLINDILDLTKIEAGQMQVDMHPTDLHQLLEDVRTIVAQRAHNKGLDLQFDLIEGLPRAALTDAVKLKQILLNLLSNALKFTNRGSVNLRASLVEGGQLQFEVADTGVGIPRNKIDTIFAAFHQAREGQATDGTGLGLAINQRLIKLLGGQPLQVESRPGEGSRFSFRIPFEALALEQLPEPDRQVEIKPGTIRLVAGYGCSVMVIDESAESRELLTTLLRYANCSVESFNDLESAAERLGEAAFDLVLLDLRLPDAGARQSVTRIRRKAHFGTPKLVAVSTRVFLDAGRHAEQAGFDALLAKPFDDRQLFSLIERLLDVRFESRPLSNENLALAVKPWPGELAAQTAQRIRAAIDLGDIGNLFQLAEELAEESDAPRDDVDNMALMARVFDFEGLRTMAERLQSIATDESPA